MSDQIYYPCEWTASIATGAQAIGKGLPLVAPVSQYLLPL